MLTTRCFSSLVLFCLSLKLGTGIGARKQLDKDYSKGICNKGEVFFPHIGLCFPTMTRGPCKEGMVTAAMTKDPRLGRCSCEPRQACYTRPVVFWPKTSQCYFLYSQGPCSQDQWLEADKDGKLKCEPVPCKILYKIQKKAEKEDETFLVSHKGECYTTFTRGFCPAGHKIYLDGETKHTPECIPERLECLQRSNSTSEGKSPEKVTKGV